jgi:lipoprotein Spr
MPLKKQEKFKRTEPVIFPLIFFLLILLMDSCAVVNHPSSTSGIKNSDRKETDHTRAVSSSSIGLRDHYAKVLGISASQIANLQLYRFIDNWMDVPYRYGGKSRSGVDCSGFTSLLMNEVFQKAVSGSSSEIFKTSSPVKESSLKEGDLVFFKINSKEVSHMGVYLANGYFVHATSHAGVIISNLNEPYYRKYFFTGGRLR